MKNNQKNNVTTNANTPETRFLPSWEYNANLILLHLERIVKSNGGEIVATYPNATREKFLIIPQHETTRKPVESHFKFLYISFTLNNNYYCYNFNSNPFFAFSFSKFPVNNNTIPAAAHSQTDARKWESFFRVYSLEETQHADAAASIFNMLLAAPTSRPANNYKNKLYPVEV